MSLSFAIDLKVFYLKKHFFFFDIRFRKHSNKYYEESTLDSFLL